MKFAVAIALLISSVAASAQVDTCLKTKNSLDRRYCVDKYLEGVKDAQATEKKGWAKGLSASDKEAKQAAIEETIQLKKDHANLIQSEISLHEKHLEALKGVTASAPASAPKEEKKKKKKGFRIKL